eukprot:7888507-Karenia_brevis.AAC.1
MATRGTDGKRQKSTSEQESESECARTKRAKHVKNTESKVEWKTSSKTSEINRKTRNEDRE